MAIDQETQTALDAKLNKSGNNTYTGNLAVQGSITVSETPTAPTHLVRLGDITSVAEQATAAAEQATAALATATSANVKANEVKQEFATINTKVAEASASADKAKTSETNAKNSETSATRAANSAETSASTATAKATEASQSATLAQSFSESISQSIGIAANGDITFINTAIYNGPAIYNDTMIANNAPVNSNEVLRKAELDAFKWIGTAEAYNALPIEQRADINFIIG